MRKKDTASKRWKPQAWKIAKAESRWQWKADIFVSKDFFFSLFKDVILKLINDIWWWMMTSNTRSGQYPSL